MVRTATNPYVRRLTSSIVAADRRRSVTDLGVLLGRGPELVLAIATPCAPRTSALAS
jgi:hypothetical protein